MKLKNKTYDILKWITLCVIPGLATFVLVLSGIWGFPYGEQIAATLTAIESLLGTWLSISNAKYKKAQQEEANGDTNRQNTDNP